MQIIRKYLPSSLILLMSVLILFSFIEIKIKNGKKHIEHSSSISQNHNHNKNINSDCDPELWNYVYNPKRLQVINKCVTVTGTIEESRPDSDGDQHMLLKLDNGQNNLLTKKNMKKKSGFLVLEAICTNKIKDHKVGNSCNGYINKIQIPRVGDHVKVTGSYVIDSHNGWGEIHPVSKIETQ